MAVHQGDQRGHGPHRLTVRSRRQAGPASGWLSRRAPPATSDLISAPWPFAPSTTVSPRNALGPMWTVTEARPCTISAAMTAAWLIGMAYPSCAHPFVELVPRAGGGLAGGEVEDCGSQAAGSRAAAPRRTKWCGRPCLSPRSRRQGRRRPRQRGRSLHRLRDCGLHRHRHRGQRLHRLRGSGLHRLRGLGLRSGLRGSRQHRLPCPWRAEWGIRRLAHRGSSPAARIDPSPTRVRTGAVQPTRSGRVLPPARRRGLGSS